MPDIVDAILHVDKQHHTRHQKGYHPDRSETEVERSGQALAEERGDGVARHREDVLINLGNQCRQVHFLVEGLPRRS